MKTYRVFLGLGSNLGDRHIHLNKAASALKHVDHVKVIWASPVYESEPYGKKDQPKFLNAAVEIETTLGPDALLDEVKAIERKLGRSTTERWGPREIDIDVLLYDGLVFESERITVPHPELEKRRFALVPLREIAPDVVHPVSGLTIEELAAACAEGGRIVQSMHRIIL